MGTLVCSKNSFDRGGSSAKRFEQQKDPPPAHPEGNASDDAKVVNKIETAKLFRQKITILCPFLLQVALVEDAELLALLVKQVEVEGEGGGVGDVGTAGGEGLADGAQDATATSVVAVVIVADAIAGDEIGLIFDGPGAGEDLEGVLAALGPVGHTDDGVELEGIGIAAPQGETQVVAGDEEQTETHIVGHGVLAAGGVEAVFAAVGEEVVLVVIGLLRATTVNEIVAITETAVDGYRKAAAEGALPIPCCLAHPMEGYGRGFILGDAVRIGGKSGGPHFW